MRSWDSLQGSSSKASVIVLERRAKAMGSKFTLSLGPWDLVVFHPGASCCLLCLHHTGGFLPEITIIQWPDLVLTMGSGPERWSSL